MLLKIISYILISVFAPLIGSLPSYLIVMIFYPFKKILGESLILFICYVSVGFTSTWIGVQILNLFNIEPSILISFVILAVFIYHYTKDASDKNLTLFGEIIGMIIGYIIFIK